MCISNNISGDVEAAGPGTRTTVLEGWGLLDGKNDPATLTFTSPLPEKDPRWRLLALTVKAAHVLGTNMDSAVEDKPGSP